MLVLLVLPVVQLNEPLNWLHGLKTLPIKVNKIVLSPISHMTLPPNQIKATICISEIDEIGGKYFLSGK